MCDGTEKGLLLLHEDNSHQLATVVSWYDTHPHTYMQDAMCEGCPAGKAICSPATSLWVSRADKVLAFRDLHKLCAKRGERRTLAAAFSSSNWQS